MNRAATALLACCALLAGCQSEPSSGTVRGVVVAVDAASPAEVRSFEVMSRGERFEFLVDPEVDYDFPLGHLQEHRVSGDPVEVRYEERDGALYALSIQDA